MKEIMNKQIKEIENLIISTKSALKNWASQIGKYHAQLKTLSQQLEAIKEEITMKENNQLNNDPKGGTN